MAAFKVYNKKVPIVFQLLIFLISHIVLQLMTKFKLKKNLYV